MTTRRLLLSVAGAGALATTGALARAGAPAGFTGRAGRRHLSTVDQPRRFGAPVAAAADPATLVAEARWQQRVSALTAALAAEPVALAVAALDRRTGRAYGYAGTTQFRTASIVKVDILATLLHKASREGRTLSTSEQRLAAAMIRHSDNDAASTLWRRTGGIAATTQVFGLTSTRQGADGDWGETSTTAEDQLRLLAHLADPHGAVPNGAYVLDLMATVADDQNWGVSAAAAPGEHTALKNGWYPTSDGWILNSIGRITGAATDLLIAVLTRGHRSYTPGIRAVEGIAARTRAVVGGEDP
jgi:beta-lactamase class A